MDGLTALKRVPYCGVIMKLPLNLLTFSRLRWIRKRATVGALRSAASRILTLSPSTGNPVPLLPPFADVTHVRF